MALTQSQRSLIERARSAGGGQQGIALDEAACAYLINVIARDLGFLDHFPAVSIDLPPFFEALPDTLKTSPGTLTSDFERLFSLDSNADTYFACLAALHKSRLKYERILQTQPIPTIDQIGPRGLLQYGHLTPKALTGFLFWRKWMYDIDNRSAQETGYLFEPIIASAIGGVPYSAARSPIRRQGDSSRGRQVDCVRDTRAYEIKLRITIAASGQGRWGEELQFPADCVSSGYTPVLVVLDSTPNAKLHQVEAAFRAQSGEVYKGQEAWNHLEGLAGTTMAFFLRRYVHEPIQTLLSEVPDTLPELVLRMEANQLVITVDGEVFAIERTRQGSESTEVDPLPFDVDDQLPGL